MNTDDARRIIERADTLPLYLHAYAYHLNMRFEKYYRVIYLISQTNIICRASKYMCWMVKPNHFPP